MGLRPTLGSLGVMEVIYRQQIWTVQRSSEGAPMSDRGSPTANHMDHVRLGLRQQRHCVVGGVLGRAVNGFPRVEKVTACVTVWPQLVKLGARLVLLHGGGLVPSDPWWYRRRHHGAHPDSGVCCSTICWSEDGRRPRSVARASLLGCRAPARRTRISPPAGCPDRAACRRSEAAARDSWYRCPSLRCPPDG